jgi:hypothetical protein
MISSTAHRSKKNRYNIFTLDKPGARDNLLQAAKSCCIGRFLSLFAFGLSAKLMPKALELLFPHPPHPPLLLIFSFKWLPVSHKMTNEQF